MGSATSSIVGLWLRYAVYRSNEQMEQHPLSFWDSFMYSDQTERSATCSLHLPSPQHCPVNAHCTASATPLSPHCMHATHFLLSSPHLSPLSLTTTFPFSALFLHGSDPFSLSGKPLFRTALSSGPFHFTTWNFPTTIQLRQLA